MRKGVSEIVSFVVIIAIIVTATVATWLWAVNAIEGLNEGESEEVCVAEDVNGNLVQVAGSPAAGCPEDSEPFAPKEALLGPYDPITGESVSLKWTAVGVGVEKTVTVPAGDVSVWVTENPDVGAIEEWEIFNLTEDAHPIHLHLVRFEVTGREAIDGGPSGVGNAPQPWENGYKDTVIAYPGEITRVKAKFDVEGLYVWHCHIVEHEDNEMMRPYYVGE